MPSTPDILHAAVVAVALVCYAVLTALGHDGLPVLTAGLGYGGGTLATKLAAAVAPSSSPTPAPPAEPTPRP